MSTSPPLLTDRATLARQRARASALFLQEEAVWEVQERLTEVNRTFTAPLVVTGFPALWPDFPCIADEDRLDVQEAAHDLVPQLLDSYPAAVWEDQDECLEVRPEDITL